MHQVLIAHNNLQIWDLHRAKEYKEGPIDNTKPNGWDKIPSSWVWNGITTINWKNLVNKSHMLLLWHYHEIVIGIIINDKSIQIK